MEEEKKVVDTEKLNAAMVEIEAKKEELSKKEYLVEGGLEVALGIRNWLINDSKWTYSECVAIYKLEEALTKAINKIETKQTSGNLYLASNELTALNILFQKYEGKGYHSAKKFREFLLPIVNTLGGSVRQDIDLVQRMEFQIASLREGVDPAPEVMDGIEKE